MFLSVAKQSQHSIIKTSKNSVTLLVNKNLVTYSYPPILRVLSHVYHLLVTKKKSKSYQWHGKLMQHAAWLIMRNKIKPHDFFRGRGGGGLARKEEWFAQRIIKFGYKNNKSIIGMTGLTWTVYAAVGVAQWTQQVLSTKSLGHSHPNIKPSILLLGPPHSLAALTLSSIQPRQWNSSKRQDSGITRLACSCRYENKLAFTR